MHSISLCIYTTPFYVVGQLGWFHILAIIISAAMNDGMQESFWISVFKSWVLIPKSGIAESYVLSILSLLNLLKYVHNIFHSGWTRQHSYSYGWVFHYILVSIDCSYYFWYVPFFLVWVDFNVVFIWISLILSETDHVFMNMLVIHLTLYF